MALTRRTRIRHVRQKLRRGELTSAEKGAIREERWKLDGGRCVDCGRAVILERGFWCSMHLMHLKSKGAGGPFTVDNTRTGCLDCHAKRHNCGGKPVPRKG